MKRTGLMAFLIILTFSGEGFTQEKETVTLTLEGAIELGLKKNLELEGALNAYKAVQSQFLQAISPQPTDYFLENAAIPKPSNLTKGYAERWSGFLQPFEFPVKWILKGVVSRREISAAEKEYELTKYEVIGKIKEGYYNVLLKAKSLDYDTRNVELLKDFHEKAKLRHEVGEAPQIEAMRARVELSKAEGNLYVAEGELELAFKNLNTLLNQPQDMPLLLTDGLIYKKYDLNLSELKKFAEGNHSLIKGAELILASKKAGRSLAYSSFFPDGYIGLYKVHYGDPSEEQKWASQINFTLPIFSFINNFGEIKGAHSNVKEAEAQLRDTKNQVFLAVEKAYKELKAAERQVEIYEGGILAEAEEMYRIANESYTEGEIGYIELLEAQRTLVSTRKEYAVSLYDYQVALSELVKAVGGRLP